VSRKLKVCMLGSFAVGKTSLVARYVKSIFSDKYLSTVGVKIDKKDVSVDGQDVSLLLWDLAGEDEYFTIPDSYLRGTAGYLLVVDGTRRLTLDKAMELEQRARSALGEVPFLVLVNKADLRPDWELRDDDLSSMNGKGWTVLETSAKTGQGVEEAFVRLAGRMLDA
jgi:small GTP-binding protein